MTANLTVLALLGSLAPSAPDGSDAPAAEPAELAGQPVTAAHVRELPAQLDAVSPGGLQAPTGGSLQIAVTDADGCGCAVPAAPPRVDRYTPSPAQRRFVKVRDRTCRHPNCGRPVARVDLDHVDAHAHGGPTDRVNLCCLCRHHHRLKTHARGWRFVLTDSGVLRVTTPSGITRTTRPPGMADRIEQPALPAPPSRAEESAPF